MLRLLVTSFALVSSCVVFHTFGLVLLTHWLNRHRSTAASQFRISRYTVLLTSVFAVIVLLHLAETLIWAAFFHMWFLFGDLETSWYFSLGTYTTIGYGDVVLPARWRMLGGLEGITGVLLCGLSTAFLFAVVSEMYHARDAQHRSSPAGRDVAKSNL